MNSRNDSWVKRWLVPLAVACCVMVLVLLTIPIAAVPAAVMGGYGGGGGGSGTSTPPAPIIPSVSVVIGPVSFSVPSAIYLGIPGTVSLTISGPDAANIDPSSLIFAGAPVQSMYFDAFGNLVVVFDKSKMNLKPGDTSAILSGNLKDGTPFSGAIPITVVP